MRCLSWCYFTLFIIACAGIFAEENLSSLKLQNWSYRWGDSSFTSENTPLWTQDTSLKWQQINLPGLPKQRKNNHYLWLKTHLPKHSAKAPAIFIVGVYHSFEVYLSNKKIYSFGKMEPRYFPGHSRHIIALPENFANQDLYLRIRSDLPKIGVIGVPYMGSRSDHILRMINYDLFRIILGILYVFTGIFQIFIYFKRKQKICRAFGLFTICIGVYTLCHAHSKQFLWNYPLLWAYIEYISLFLIPVFFYMYFIEVFHSGPKNILNYILKIHIAYAAISTLFAIFIGGLWQHFLLPFQILLIGGVIILFVIALNTALRGDSKAKIYTFGFAILGTFGVYDVLINIQAVDSSLTTSHWGVFIFIVCQGIILEIRFVETQILLAQIHKACRRFVPWEFLRLLDCENIVQMNLGDQIQVEMTVLFSDIRDFTSLSESMTPEENFNFLNSYLKQVGPIIRKNGGFIDKYIGDAIMALFPKDAKDAVQAAREIIEKVEIYNKNRGKCGYRPIQIGIGIHTGNLMLGIIGEEERIEGTVIADAVNLASRLEGLTKHYGVNILTSEHTLNALKDLPSYRFLDEVRVKGKADSIAIFEVFTDTKKEYCDKFNEALEFYKQREFSQALTIFNKLKTISSGDRVVEIYIKRCQNFIDNGLPENWEGIKDWEEK